MNFLNKFFRKLLSDFTHGANLMTSNVLTSSKNLYGRGIHILVELYNETMRTLLFLFLFSCGMIQINCAVTLIYECKQYSVGGSHMPISLILFFTFSYIQQILIILVVYGFAGGFYRQSKEFLEVAKRNIGGGIKYTNCIAKKERQYRKMYLLSCQIERVKFGLSNFIEDKTPPIFQLFCMDRIIDSLLIL